MSLNPERVEAHTDRYMYIKADSVNKLLIPMLSPHVTKARISRAVNIVLAAFQWKRVPTSSYRELT